MLRALQLRKAVLLEGSPGVGKTSLVAALAAASGKITHCSGLTMLVDLARTMWAPQLRTAVLLEIPQGEDNSSLVQSVTQQPAVCIISST